MHQQISEQVEQLISAGRLSPGQQLPTHKEMARLLSVHPMTIGRSYSQLQSQGVITQQRGRGTFVSEVEQTPKDIVLLAPEWAEIAGDMTSAYSHQVALSGMEHACREIAAHLRVLMAPRNLDDAGLAEWAAHIRKHHCGVLTPMPEHLPLLTMLASEGFPAVFYPRDIDSPRVSNCSFGWYEAVKRSTGHLLSLGRKRITYLGPIIDNPIVNHDGFDGFLASLDAADMPYYPRLSVRFSQRASVAELARAIEQAILENRIGDAIVCHAAFGTEAGTSCIRLLKKHGRRVPDDVAVVGFAEDMTAALCDPPLTWIPYPQFEIGREIIDMVHKLMLDPACAPLRRTLVPELVPGQSCGGFPDGNGRIDQVYATGDAQPAGVQERSVYW